MLSFSGADDVVYAPLDDTLADAAFSGPSNTHDIDPKQLLRQLSAFRSSRPLRSAWELASTLLPFMFLCGVMLAAVHAGHLLALLLTVPAGLLLLRLFLIQHDCGHGAFLPRRSGNDWLGRMLGVLTLTPYDCWRRSHALHHAGTGNLDDRGFGDVNLLTVREFQTRSRSRQLLYRLYRHPVILFGLGPAYLFLVRHRLPIGLMRAGWIYWVSAIATNVATALLLGALMFWLGVGVVSLIFVPVLLIAATIGVWLFYIQHQFERTHWDERAVWSFHEAALRGSSYLVLPSVLRWFTANIGVHHVHHLASRIPFYRLPEVLRAYPRLIGLNRLTPLQTLGTLRLALWDEEQRRLVPFPSRRRQTSSHNRKEACDVAKL